MNAKVLLAGLLAGGVLLAQPPGGPRGRGPMGFGGPGGAGRGGPVATVAGAPYSAVEVRTSQQVLAAGNTIQRTDKTNVYRDSQGRVRRETTRTGPDGQTHTRREHLRSGGGHRYGTGREEQDGIHAAGPVPERVADHPAARGQRRARAPVRA